MWFDFFPKKRYPNHIARPITIPIIRACELLKKELMLIIFFVIAGISCCIDSKIEAKNGIITIIITSATVMKKRKVRKNGLQLKKEKEREEEEIISKEKFWETPSFLRRKKPKGQ